MADPLRGADTDFISKSRYHSFRVPEVRFIADDLNRPAPAGGNHLRYCDSRIAFVFGHVLAILVERDHFTVNQMTDPRQARRIIGHCTVAPSGTAPPP